MTSQPSARRRFHACALALGVLSSDALCWGARGSGTTTRVRSEHPVIVDAIAEASEHSATFRSLSEAIEGTDGIVYIRDGPCPLLLRACLTGARRAPPMRFVFISVDRRRSAGCRLMASLGHELQHALEVLGNPEVTDNGTLAQFFMRIGPTGDAQRFETPAASRAELRVEQELRAARRCSR
jgi:hypothetical protein